MLSVASAEVLHLLLLVGVPLQAERAAAVHEMTGLATDFCATEAPPASNAADTFLQTASRKLAAQELAIEADDADDEEGDEQVDNELAEYKKVKPKDFILREKRVFLRPKYKKHQWLSTTLQTGTKVLVDSKVKTVWTVNATSDGKGYVVQQEGNNYGLTPESDGKDPPLTLSPASCAGSGSQNKKCQFKMYRAQNGHDYKFLTRDKSRRQPHGMGCMAYSEVDDRIYLRSCWDEKCVWEFVEVTRTCTWDSPHSGAQQQPLCEDGTYSWNCMKDGHGQRAQCPPNLPKMCLAQTCGGGKDYCCETNCNNHVGLRTCMSEAQASPGVPGLKGPPGPPGDDGVVGAPGPPGPPR